MSTTTYGPMDSFDTETAQAVAGDLLAVHAASYGASARAQSVSDLFDLVGASTNIEILTRGQEGRLVGYVLGGRQRISGPTWQSITESLPQIAGETATAYVIGDLVVSPENRRRGHGRLLLEGLLFDRSETVALAHVPADQGEAKEAFRSWGWREVNDATFAVALPMAQAYTD